MLPAIVAVVVAALAGAPLVEVVVFPLVVAAGVVVVATLAGV